MSRPIAPDPLDDDADELDPALAAGAARPTVDLATLPIVGLTRRRMAMIASAFLAAWIVVAFARQVAEASAAATRAEDIARGNAVAPAMRKPTPASKSAVLSSGIGEIACRRLRIEAASSGWPSTRGSITTSSTANPRRSS